VRGLERTADLVAGGGVADGQGVGRGVEGAANSSLPVVGQRDQLVGDDLVVVVVEVIGVVVTANEITDGSAVGGVLVALAEHQVGVADDLVAAGGVGQYRYPFGGVGTVSSGGRRSDGAQGGGDVADGGQQAIDLGHYGVVGGIDVFRADVADGAFGGSDGAGQVGTAGGSDPGSRLGTDVSGGEGAVGGELGRALAVQVTGEYLGGAAAAGTVDDRDGGSRVAGVDLVPGGDGAREDVAQLSTGQVQVVQRGATGKGQFVGDGHRGGGRGNLDQRAPVGGAAGGNGRGLVSGLVGGDLAGGQDGIAAGVVDGDAGSQAQLGGVVGQHGGFASAAAHADVGVEARRQDGSGVVQVLRQSGAATDYGSHGLGGAQAGDGHGNSENIALEHEESPFIVSGR